MDLDLDMKTINYSKQEVIVEKVTFPEGMNFRDPRAMCVKNNGEVLLLDLHRSPPVNLAALSNMELKPEVLDGDHGSLINYPIGVWANEDDTITISNTYSNQVVTLANGTHTVLLDKETVQGPRGIYKDKQGNLFICDARNNRIMKYSHDGQVSQVNKGTQPTPFNLPTGICVLDSGEVIVADCENNCIQKIDLQGNTTVIAGVPNVIGGYSDYAPVELSWPYNVKPLGPHLVFVEARNNAVRVILKNGRVVSLNTRFGSSVKYLRGLAVDKNENIYVSGVSNTLFRIRPKPNVELALLIFTIYNNDNFFAILPRELILIIIDFAALNWHLS